MSFTTTKGVAIDFVSVEALAAQIHLQYGKRESDLEALGCPSYEVTTLGGVTEKHYYTEDVVSSTDNPVDPKIKSDFETYLTNLRTLQADHHEKINRLVFVRGVKFDMPTDESWIKDHEGFGLVVPTDLVERRIYWLQTEAIGTTADLEAILEGVAKASGVLEEEVVKATESFRDQVERIEGTVSGTDQRKTRRSKVK